MSIHIHGDPQQLISFKASTELVARIEKASIAFNCTKSILIRQLLSQGLDPFRGGISGTTHVQVLNAMDLAVTHQSAICVGSA